MNIYTNFQTIYSSRWKYGCFSLFGRCQHYQRMDVDNLLWIHGGRNHEHDIAMCNFGMLLLVQPYRRRQWRAPGHGQFLPSTRHRYVWKCLSFYNQMTLAVIHLLNNFELVKRFCSFQLAMGSNNNAGLCSWNHFNRSTYAVVHDCQWYDFVVLRFTVSAPSCILSNG